MATRSLQHNQRIADGNAVALANVDFGDGTRTCCTDFSFHLHRLKNDQHVTFINRIAKAHIDFEDVSGQRGSDGSTARCCWGIARRLSLFFYCSDLPSFSNLYQIPLAIDLDGVSLRTSWCIRLGLACSGRGGSWLGVLLRHRWRRLKGIRIVAIFEELEANLRKQRIGQYIVDFALPFGQPNTIGFGLLRQFSGQSLHLGLEVIRGATLDRLATLKHPVLQRLVERCRRRAIFSPE